MDQLTVFVENKKGSLKRVTKALEEADVNIISFSLADTENYGLMRMIVDDSEKGCRVLRENNIMANVQEVTVVHMPNIPGSLHKLIGLVEDFAIEYLYMFSNSEKISGVVLKIDEFKSAEEKIKEAGYELIESYENII